MEYTGNLMDDLRFLFAADDELNRDLSYVCDLLNPPERSPVSEDGKTKTVTGKRPVQTQYKRQQLEILELRRQVDLLKEKLLQAKRFATVKPDMSLWERAARDQIYAKSKSFQENEHLQASVEESTTFIEDMTRLLRKKPRLSFDVHSEEWRTYKLAAQASLRTAAIHAIADYQYNQLQTAFIKAGVHQCPDQVIQFAPKLLSDGQIIYERVYHVPLAAPYRLIGAATWKVFNGEYPIRLPDGAEETLEVLDPFTVYRAFQNVHESSSAHVNMIYKYYVECNREVIVWRSVLEDALVPRMAQGTVTNKWGWLVVEPTADAESCRVTFLLQVVPAPLQNDQKATLADYLTAAKVMAEKYAFGQPPEIPGTFPGGAVNETIEAALTFARRTFVEHDKELEWSLKCAIDQVVLEYQASHAERYLF
ncbi:unnamed protein product, partial [Aphanomyces euteiches]